MRARRAPKIGITVSLDGEGEMHARAHEARAIIEKLECPTCKLECEVYRDIKKD